MDPLSAFSLACAVLQMVDFSYKLISATKSLYQKGSLEENDDLETHLSALRSALNSKRGLNCASYQLVELAGECNVTAQELLGELDNLEVSNSLRM